MNGITTEKLSGEGISGQQQQQHQEEEKRGGGGSDLQLNYLKVTFGILRCRKWCENGSKERNDHWNSSQFIHWTVSRRLSEKTAQGTASYERTDGRTDENTKDKDQMVHLPITRTTRTNSPTSKTDESKLNTETRTCIAVGRMFGFAVRTWYHLPSGATTTVFSHLLVDRWMGGRWERKHTMSNSHGLTHGCGMVVSKVSALQMAECNALTFVALACGFHLNGLIN